MTDGRAAGGPAWVAIETVERPLERMVDVEAFGSDGEDDEKRTGRQDVEDVGQSVETRRIGPLDVIPQQDEAGAFDQRRQRGNNELDEPGSCGRGLIGIARNGCCQRTHVLAHVDEVAEALMSDPERHAGRGFIGSSGADTPSLGREFILDRAGEAGLPDA